LHEFDEIDLGAVLPLTQAGAFGSSGWPPMIPPSHHALAEFMPPVPRSRRPDSREPCSVRNFQILPVFAGRIGLKRRTPPARLPFQLGDPGDNRRYRSASTGYGIAAGRKTAGQFLDVDIERMRNSRLFGE